MKDNPLLALDFDKVKWWRCDRDNLEITVAYGDLEKPHLKFNFQSLEEFDEAYNEYWGLPPYPPNL